MLLVCRARYGRRALRFVHGSGLAGVLTHLLSEVFVARSCLGARRHGDVLVLGRSVVLVVALELELEVIFNRG